jgi:GNAT superfamily N-acetyltransferase
MSPPVRIRPPRPDDAARLADLSGELGYPASAAGLATHLQQVHGREDHYVRIAVDDQDRPIGWIHAHETMALESGAWGEIMGLVVGTGARRRGVASALVQDVEAWVQARGLQVIKVRSNAARAESHPFYEQLGYERIKSQHVYRRMLAR